MFEVSDDPEYDYDRVAFRLTSAPIKNLTVSARYSMKTLIMIRWRFITMMRYLTPLWVLVQLPLIRRSMVLMVIARNMTAFPGSGSHPCHGDRYLWPSTSNTRFFPPYQPAVGLRAEEIDRDEEELNENRYRYLQVAVNSRYFKNIRHAGSSISIRISMILLSIRVRPWPTPRPSATGYRQKRLGNPACPADPTYSSANLALPWLSDVTEYYVMYKQPGG